MHRSSISLLSASLNCQATLSHASGFFCGLGFEGLRVYGFRI